MKSYTNLSTLVLALSLVSSASAMAHASKSCVFAPENNLKIPVGFQSKAGAGIDEKTYNAMIDQVENYYQPIAKTHGAVLKINRMWTTDTVNSTAHQSGKSWYVDAYGGLARYPIMTADAESAVLCHEMGHHLGGFPKIHSLFGSSWASNEGEADYFATMKCFCRVHENDDNASIIANMTVPTEVKAGCSSTFKSMKEIALCTREALAGQVLAQILYQLGHGSSAKVAIEPATAPSFSTPDTTSVSSTNDQHPAAQCRLDTYFNGSICGMAATDDFGPKDAATGACAEEKHDKYGFRPRCWFKPSL